MRILGGPAAMEGRRSKDILSAWFFDYSREYLAFGSTALAAAKPVSSAATREDGRSELVAGSLQAR